MHIYIGADHRGFQLKKLIQEYLIQKGYHVIDVGSYEYNENDDYPDYAKKVARGVAENFEDNRGIVICGSGIGVSIVANRHKGIRAFIPLSVEHAVLARKHNDTNVIAFAADFMNFDDIKSILDVWLTTPFSCDVRHKRRIRAMDNI
ncbi:MAG: ribose 5-phosphate isomerase B [bacterium]